MWSIAPTGNKNAQNIDMNGLTFNYLTMVLVAVHALSSSNISESDS